MSTPTPSEEGNSSPPSLPATDGSKHTGMSLRERLDAMGTKNGNLTGPKAVILPGSGGLPAKHRSDSMITGFRIGDFQWCEPDYRQIHLWAEALSIKPEEVIRRLLEERNLIRGEGDPQVGKISTEKKTAFVGGRMRCINWDFDILALAEFQWVEGLVIEHLTVSSKKNATIPANVGAIGSAGW